jgi:hypothetical protein
MKKYIVLIIVTLACNTASLAQTINAAYAKALHKKYQPQPTNFCSSCKLWVNPYYKSIADTVQHRPVLTYYVYTKANRLEQERLKLKREGTIAAWFPAYGQPKEDSAYTEANKIVNQPDLPGEIQKGHCQAWILLAYSIDGAILSDTYTFNSAMEFRGQNLGTEIASEERCRTLTGFEGRPEITDKIQIWCGTFGSQRTFTTGRVTNTVPTHYYKILNYYDKVQHRQIEEVYWFPNQPGETGDQLMLRTKSYTELCALLHFKPKDIFR